MDLFKGGINMFKFNDIEDAVADIRAGKIIIVIDDEDRENEGDLVMAAEKVTGEAINFMATYGKGLICTPMEEEILKELQINSMVENNTDNHETAFTVSVDYKDTTTGISAYERALTISKLLENGVKPEDFRRPGHVFPLAAKKNGVLERTGHTEAAVDLAKLAGLKGAGVICEVMKEDGHMARTEDLIKMAKEHNLKIITVKSLLEYRKANEKIIERVAEAKHKSWEHESEYRIICFRDDFPAIPSKIYIGLNCSEEHRKALVEVGRSIDMCKVYQMEFDEDSEVFGLKKRLII